MGGEWMQVCWHLSRLPMVGQWWGGGCELRARMSLEGSQDIKFCVTPGSVYSDCVWQNVERDPNQFYQLLGLTNLSLSTLSLR